MGAEAGLEHAAGGISHRHRVNIQFINSHIARFDPLAGCALVGCICQLGGFRFSVSICQPAARHADHHRHLACDLCARRPLASTFLREGKGCVD